MASDDDEGGHGKGDKKGKFCALRRKKCPCGNEHTKNCDPAPTGWEDETYGDWAHRDKRKKKKRGIEAHHLLCVANVTEVIIGASGIQRIVAKTKWCINEKVNMYPMPLWGHTIQYYCNLETRWGLGIADRMISRRNPPKFEDFPQHNYDHTSSLGYQWEVVNELKKIIKRVKEAKDKHKDASGELFDALNEASRHFRKELTRRGGNRCGGTHNAWTNGRTMSNWYEPFSMADDGNINKMSFPTLAPSEEMAEKVAELVKSFIR